MRRTTVLILLAFVVSVAVRWPQLNRPLSKHHEFCTAVALIIMQVWDEGGFAANDGLPCVTFPGEANEHIADQTDGLVQRDGKHYYVSHLPLAYYLPFAFFKAIAVRPDVRPLQLFNLFFHLLTTLALAAIVRLLLNEAEEQHRERAALMAGLLYLFMPAMLWYHGNVYMADMFVQNVWVVHVYFALKLFAAPRPSGKATALFTLTLSLTAFTNWLGVFAGVAAMMLAWRRWRWTGDRSWLRMIPVAVLAVAIPVGWTLWRFASIAGWDNLLAHYNNRYAERGSEAFGGIAGFGYFLWRLLFNYITSFAPLLMVIAGVWFWRRGASLEWSSTTRSLMLMFVSLALVPVALDHIVFLKYALHDFAVLKASLFLCVFAAMGLKDARRGTTIAVMACVLGVAMFHVINRPGPIAQNGDRYDTQEQLGRTIAARAGGTHVVFITSDVPRDPMVIFYAHRNLLRAGSADEAKAFLREHQHPSGVLFDMREGQLVDQRITGEP